jgi:hypothetical protein
MITIASFKQSGYERLELVLPDDRDFYSFLRPKNITTGVITLDDVTNKILLINLDYFVERMVYDGGDLGLECSIFTRGENFELDFDKCETEFKNGLISLVNSIRRKDIDGINQILRAIKRKLYNTHEVKTEYIKEQNWDMTNKSNW